MSQVNTTYRNLSVTTTGTEDVTGTKSGGATSGDIQGAGQQSPAAFARPALPAPLMSAAAMMIALTALQSKVLEQNIEFGEKTMDGLRKDIQDKAVKRAEQMKTYFQNMDKQSSTQRCGLFGAIIHFFKNLAEGKPQEALDVLTHNIGSILKDVATLVVLAVSVIAAVAIAAATCGVGTGVVLLCAGAVAATLAGMVLADPGITDLVVNLLPEDWRMGVGIALAIAGLVCSVAGAIMLTVATGGAGAAGAVGSLATISVGVANAVSSLVSAGVSVQQGVEGYQQSGYKAGAIRATADMDITESQMEQIKATLDRSQKDLKTLYDAFAGALSSVRDMIIAYGQNQNRAASV